MKGVIFVKKRNVIMVILCFLVLFAIPMKVNATTPINMKKGATRMVSSGYFTCPGHSHSFKVSGIKSENCSIATTYRKDGKFYVHAAKRTGSTTIRLIGYCKTCKKDKNLPIVVSVK